MPRKIDGLSHSETGDSASPRHGRKAGRAVCSADQNFIGANETGETPDEINPLSD